MPVTFPVKTKSKAENEMAELAELYGDIMYRTQEECFAFFERMKPIVEKGKKETHYIRFNLVHCSFPVPCWSN